MKSTELGLSAPDGYDIVVLHHDDPLGEAFVVFGLDGAAKADIRLPPGSLAQVLAGGNPQVPPSEDDLDLVLDDGVCDAIRKAVVPAPVSRGVTTLSEEQKQEIRKGFHEWSGGDDPVNFYDEDDESVRYDAYAEHYEHEGVPQEDLEAFLDEWYEEGDAAQRARWAAEASDPVVWTGKVGSFDVRVRRVSEKDVVAESLYGGDWCPSPDDVALRAVTTAYLSELHGRGLP